MTNMGSKAFSRIFNTASLFTVLFPLLVLSISRLSHVGHNNYYYGQRYLEEAEADDAVDQVDDGNWDNEEYMEGEDDLYWDNEEYMENGQDWEGNEEYRANGKSNGDKKNSENSTENYRYGRQTHDDYAAPAWWIGAGRSMYPEQERKVGTIMSYLYLLAVFAGLTTYGNHVINRETEYGGLQGALVMFSNLAVAVMFLVAGSGIVETEHQAVQAQGWYGQLSVCIYLTCFCWFFHGLVFSWMLKDRRGSETPCTIRPEEDIGGKYFEYR